MTEGVPQSWGRVRESPETQPLFGVVFFYSWHIKLDEGVHL